MSSSLIKPGSVEAWALNLACFLDNLCSISGRQGITPFTTVQSNYSLPLYARILGANLGSSPSAFVVASILAERLYLTQPDFYTAASPHKLFVGLIVVATKWSDDKCFKNPQFASICGVTPKVLCHLEKLILSGIQYHTFVQTEEFNTFQSRIDLLRDSTPKWRTENLPAEVTQTPVLRFAPSRPIHKSPAIKRVSSTTSDTTDSDPCSSDMAPVRRARWTTAEDCALKEAVRVNGDTDWKAVASALHAKRISQYKRDPRSCAARWKNALNPSVNHKPFSPEEDAELVRLVQAMGTCWEALATRGFVGRTARQCMNRYAALKRKGVVDQLIHDHRAQQQHHNQHEARLPPLHAVIAISAA